MSVPRRTIEHGGKTYVISPSDTPGHVDITCEHELIGSWLWDGNQLVDCTIGNDETGNNELINSLEDALQAPFVSPRVLPTANSATLNSKKTVRRYLSIEPLGPIRLDEPFRLSIDLKKKADHQEDELVSIEIDGEAKSHICEIEITSSPEIHIETPNGLRLLLRLHGSSRPCEVTCTLRSMAASGQSNIQVRLLYSKKEIRTKTFRVDTSQHDLPYIRVIMNSNGSLIHWTVDVIPHEALESCEGIESMDGSISTKMAVSCSQQIIHLLTSKNTPSELQHRRVALWGQKLYEITPIAFKKIYSQLRRKWGQLRIQFYHDGPYVPWELMCAGNDQETMNMRDIVARWPNQYRGRLPRPDVIRGSAHAIIAGETMDRISSLEEMKLLYTELGVKHTRPLRNDAMKLLSGETHGRVALVYFAGHGRTSKRNVSLTTINLDDGPICASDIAASQTSLGETDGTFVFFNCCEVGQDTRAGATTTTWPDALIVRGFRGFIAPIHQVTSDEAFLFAKELLTRIVDHRGSRSVATLLRDLRKVYSREHPQLLAYVYYGSVDTRLEVDTT
ncbi:hypothetical protein ACMHYB_03350 [Sorangium sp. So ce1128]